MELVNNLSKLVSLNMRQVGKITKNKGLKLYLKTGLKNSIITIVMESSKEFLTTLIKTGIRSE